MAKDISSLQLDVLGILACGNWSNWHESFDMPRRLFAILDGRSRRIGKLIIRLMGGEEIEGDDPDLLFAKALLT